MVIGGFQAKVLGVYNVVHGRRASVLSLYLEVILFAQAAAIVVCVMARPSTPEYDPNLPPMFRDALEDLCLVCEPNYGGFMRLAAVSPRGRVFFCSPELQITAYRSWFDKYALHPAVIEELAYYGRLELTPPYLPCGKFS